MIHTRQDYNRIQDPENLIPKDEPVFLFRAQDKYSEKVLRFYKELIEQDGGDKRILDAIDTHLIRSISWHVKKAPDMPA